MGLIKRLRDDVELPSYASYGAAGFDLASAEDAYVRVGVLTLIPTGLVIETPPGHMLMLVLRSSTPKKWGVTMPHGIGIVDEDYCGDNDEIFLQVIGIQRHNPDGTEALGDWTGPRWPSWLIPKGTRIAQGIFVPVTRSLFAETTATIGATRGGFGSTGS